MEIPDLSQVGAATQPRNVRECLDEARTARSPAESLQALYLAVAYLSQQTEELEKGVGVQDAPALEGIRARARRLLRI